MSDPEVTPPSPDTGSGRDAVAVPDALIGQRVDRVVALVADVSRREAADLIAAGRVAIDGRAPLKSSERLEAGATIAIDHVPVTPVLHPAPDVEVPVIHVDAHVLVVDKPADLVVHPGSGVTDGTMIQALLARYPDIADAGGDRERPGLVHRLDRGTSGLLMVARTDAARRHLMAQLAQRQVERVYLALTWGCVAAEEGLIDAPLGRSPRDATRQAVVADGRPARTHYRVLARHDDPELTLVQCRLETGRTHQIRVHFEAIGHPVVGDRRYGRRPSVPGLDRQFLHAARLGFRHPVTDELLRFESPLPPDLTAVLSSFGLDPPGPMGETGANPIH